MNYKIECLDAEFQGKLKGMALTESLGPGDIKSALQQRLGSAAIVEVDTMTKMVTVKRYLLD